MLFRPKLLILSEPPIAHSATLRSGLASPRRAQSPFHHIFFLLRLTTRGSVCITAIP